MMESTADGEHFEDEFGHTTSKDGGKNEKTKLGMWQGVALLTADCLGVGVLALPQDVHVLGRFSGLAFLLLQIPINYYAGYILAWTAVQIEKDSETCDSYSIDGDGTTLEMATQTSKDKATKTEDSNGESESLPDDSVSDAPNDTTRTMEGSDYSDLKPRRRWQQYHNVASATDKKDVDEEDDILRLGPPVALPHSIDPNADNDGKDGIIEVEELEAKQHSSPSNASTVDFIGISAAVFSRDYLEGTTPSSASSSPFKNSAQNMVMLLYYLNIFLVLGDYMLVMAHAVAAVWDGICITTAGLIASTLMFAICQLNTMALLGQYVSMASLTALAIVLVQCVWEANQRPSMEQDTSSPVTNTEDTGNGNRLLRTLADDSHPSILRKFSALASICFALGSQKLFLNIRHELHDREKDAMPVFSRSLGIFGMAYVVVILLSGNSTYIYIWVESIVRRSSFGGSRGTSFEPRLLTFSHSDRSSFVSL